MYHSIHAIYTHTYMLDIVYTTTADLQASTKTTCHIIQELGKKAIIILCTYVAAYIIGINIKNVYIHLSILTLQSESHCTIVR